MIMTEQGDAHHKLRARDLSTQKDRPKAISLQFGSENRSNQGLIHHGPGGGLGNGGRTGEGFHPEAALINARPVDSERFPQLILNR
jgi:hypothetical protein